MLEGSDIHNVAAIMANRLGELIRIFPGDKELLKGTVFNLIINQMNKEYNDV